MKSAPGLPPAPSGPPKAPPQALGTQGGPSTAPLNTSSPFTPGKLHQDFDHDLRFVRADRYYGERKT